MTRIRIDRRGPSFTVVDERIYARHQISIAARHVLGWMLGRSVDYEIRVAVVQSIHGMSETQWKRVRDELKKDGWLIQVRDRDEKGRVVWEIIVTDRPLETIPPKPGDGTIPPKPMDGSAIHGKQGDNYHEVDLHEVDLHETPSPKPPPRRRAARALGGECDGKREGDNGHSAGAVVGLASQQEQQLVDRIAARHGVDAQALLDELIGRRSRSDLAPVGNLAAWLEKAGESLAAGVEQFAQTGREWRAARAPRDATEAARLAPRQLSDPKLVQALRDQLRDLLRKSA